MNGGEISGFQLAMLIAQASMTVITLLIGVMLNHLLQEIRALRTKDDECTENVREIERTMFPRTEFQRYEDRQVDDRHQIKERIGVLEIKAGAWGSPHS